MRILVGVALFGLAARLGLLLLPVAPHPATWVIPMLRPDAFVVGMLVAVAHERGTLPAVARRAPQPLLLAAAGVLLAAVTAFPNIDSGSWHRLWQYPAVALAFGALLVALLGDGGARRLFATAALVGLGRISYGLYVYQLLALQLASTVFARLALAGHGTPLVAWAAECLLGLVLTILFAATSYRWLERPFLRRKEAWAVVRSRPA